MRTFFSGAGADSTSAVKTFLSSGSAIQAAVANLILIGEPEDDRNFYLTDYELDLSWPIWGTFKRQSLEMDKVTSKFGLQVDNVNLRWSPPQGMFTNNLLSTSPYQLAQIGWFDNKKVRIWRTLMATPGDANTYGACDWFGGWIANSTVERGAITFQVNSFLNVLSMKLPANLLEGTSALAGFLSGTPVLVDAETNVPTFTVVAGSDAIQILATCIQPTPGKIYGNNKLALGYLVFLTGSLKGAYSTVANNYRTSPGPIHYNQIQVYTPFPWDPTPGDTFYVTTQPPLTQTDAVANQYQYQGFPWLPDPETNL